MDLGTGTLGSGTLGNPSGSFVPIQKTLSWISETTAVRSISYIYWALSPIPIHSFADALTQSHSIVTRATLLPAGGGFETILTNVVEGEVTLDANAEIRGRCDVRLIDDGTFNLTPRVPNDLLSPYGNEIRLERGIRYSDGFEKLFSLGIFRIDSSDVEDIGTDFGIRCTGLDRSARIHDARFEAPATLAAGTNYGELIEAVAIAGYPSVITDFHDTTETAPQLSVESSDSRWEFCQNAAKAIGMELFFNGDGILILKPVTQIGEGIAIWTIAEGLNGVLINTSRRWTREGAFNRVIATGENLGDEGTPPVRGVATDDNPMSPTYYEGSFGKVPRFFVSEFITTEEQAISAAESILAKELGTTQQVNFGSIVNPALVPGNIVRIAREKIGLDENHIIDTLQIPLSAEGIMTGTTRATQVFS